LKSIENKFDAMTFRQMSNYQMTIGHKTWCMGPWWGCFKLRVVLASLGSYWHPSLSILVYI